MNITILKQVWHIENKSVYLSIHPALDYLCTSVFPLGQARSTDFICQLPYSSLRFMGWYKHCNEWYYSFWTVPQLNGNTTAFFLWVFVLLAFSEKLYVHQQVHGRQQAWDVGSWSRRLPTSSFLWQWGETKWRPWVHTHLFILCHWQKRWQKIPEQSVIYSWNTLKGSNSHLEKRKEKVSRAFCCHPGMEVVLHVHEGTLLHGMTVAEVCLGSEVCLWASFYGLSSQETFNDTLLNEMYPPEKQLVLQRRKRGMLTVGTLPS